MQFQRDLHAMRRVPHASAATPQAFAFACCGLAEAIFCTLRGFGQVILQKSFVAGLLLMMGIFLCTWLEAVCALLGTVAATSAAVLLGVPRRDVQDGLYGFNGALIGLALGHYASQDAVLVPCTIAAAAFGTLSTATLKLFLGAWERVLTAPFVATTWVALAAMARLDGTHGTAGAVSAMSQFGEAGSLGLTGTLVGVLNGLSQVVLQQNAWMGLAILAALAAASGTACVAALAGSTIGFLTAWALGADEAAMRAGLYGYNAALTAIGIAVLSRHPGLPRMAMALGLACASTIAYAGLSPTLAGFGVPVLTLPFVVTIWLYILAEGVLRRARSRPG